MDGTKRLCGMADKAAGASRKAADAAAAANRLAHDAQSYANCAAIAASNAKECEERYRGRLSDLATNCAARTAEAEDKVQQPSLKERMQKLTGELSSPAEDDDPVTFTLRLNGVPVLTHWLDAQTAQRVQHALDVSDEEDGRGLLMIKRAPMQDEAAAAARAAARAQDARYHKRMYASAIHEADCAARAAADAKVKQPSDLLTLEDIDRALNAFPGYHSLHVFASEVFAGRMQVHQDYAPGSTKQGVYIFRRQNRCEPASVSVSPILAMLVGDQIGDPVRPPERNRRIFPLQFDARTREWSAYDGGLVPWLKEQLL